MHYVEECIRNLHPEAVAFDGWYRRICPTTQWNLLQALLVNPEPSRGGGGGGMAYYLARRVRN